MVAARMEELSVKMAVPSSSAFMHPPFSGVFEINGLSYLDRRSRTPGLAVLDSDAHWKLTLHMLSLH